MMHTAYFAFQVLYNLQRKLYLNYDITVFIADSLT